MREKLFLYVVAGFYLLFAILYFVFPAALTEPMGLTASNAGLIDIRAVFGGVQLGLAIFLWWSTQADDRIYPGLLVTVLLTGGIALGRILGIILAGEIGNHWIGLVIEIVVTGIGVWLILRRK